MITILLNRYYRPDAHAICDKFIKMMHLENEEWELANDYTLGKSIIQSFGDLNHIDDDKLTRALRQMIGDL